MLFNPFLFYQTIRSTSMRQADLSDRISSDRNREDRRSRAQTQCTGARVLVIYSMSMLVASSCSCRRACSCWHMRYYSTILIFSSAYYMHSHRIRIRARAPIWIWIWLWLWIWTWIALAVVMDVGPLLVARFRSPLYLPVLSARLVHSLFDSSALTCIFESLIAHHYLPAPCTVDTQYYDTVSLRSALVAGA